MTDETAPSFTESLGALPQRVGALVELLTTLDLRVRSALEGLEEMRRSVAPLEGVGTSGDELVNDVRARMAALDDRLNRDLDELKETIRLKLEEVDVKGFNERLDRLEAAVFNIERATVHLDQAFQGGLEILPDFVSKRLRTEGRAKGPSTTDDPRA